MELRIVNTFHRDDIASMFLSLLSTLFSFLLLHKNTPDKNLGTNKIIHHHYYLLIPIVTFTVNKLERLTRNVFNNYQTKNLKKIHYIWKNLCVHIFSAWFLKFLSSEKIMVSSGKPWLRVYFTWNTRWPSQRTSRLRLPRGKKIDELYNRIIAQNFKN